MMTTGPGRSAACAGMTRREFVRLGATGLGSLGLVNVDTIAGVEPTTERSVILILLVGGPSQLETWDPKPDAPAEVRGPFRSIATRCPGVRICEHLPRMAARMDRLALIRSIHHDTAPIHEAGYQLLQTGRLCQSGEAPPHFGSVIGRLEGGRSGVPPFVIIPGPIAGTGVDIPRGQSPGWLGAPFEPCHLAVDPTASDLDPGDEYGLTTLGRSCRMARQLVCSGVRSVTINMFDTVFNRVTWDCHGAAPFSKLDDYARELLPNFDRAFTALIDDLERHGRLETTLVVAAGEFGRSPRLNASGGRDHWPGVWSIVLAGGGIHGGQVLGASDAHAEAPADRPVTPAEIVATIYHSLGIDETQCLSRPDGASYRLVEGAAPIRELFA
jgi:hypothetical protein